MSKKIRILYVTIASILFLSATEATLAQWDNSTYLLNIIKSLEETIRLLKDENAILKAKITPAQTSVSVSNWATTQITSSWSSAQVQTWTTTKTQTWTNVKPSSIDKYNKLIDKINASASDIFRSEKLSTWSTIWLFEFIEPSNFFISIDDKANPSWVAAFKRKILYSYDEKLNLEIVWRFDLDYNSWYYVTVFWKNPFARIQRIRVKNPSYDWKLLDETTTQTQTWVSQNTSSTTTSKTTTTSTSTTNTVSTTNITADSIKAAYASNKILDALKLSNEYIKSNPNNIEILVIRYRSYYILWKYTESLAEIQKIESIKWDSIDKIIVCDAKTIAKLWKNTELNTKYAALCSKR